jgi:hypothetical protein
VPLLRLHGTLAPAPGGGKARGGEASDRFSLTLRRQGAQDTRIMLGKLLLTVAIIVLAVYAIRERLAGASPAGAAAGTRSLSPRHRLIQTAAVLVVVIMLVGSGLALLKGWGRARDVVTVEVANPITGAVERFEARRTDVGDRTIRTLDGRRIRVSEVERIIVLDE